MLSIHVKIVNLSNSVQIPTVPFYFSGHPVITSARDVNDVVNSNVVLTCNVISNPPPNITWYFNGSAISTNSNNRGLNLLKNGSLRITQALKSDSGVYTCEARNIFGGRNETLTLRITGNVSYRYI